MNTHSLWRATLVNTLVSVALFALFFLLLWLSEQLFPDVSLLHFDNFAWCVGIPASIIGVAYVLTIRDPNNYTGFYAGIVMSALLAWQCFLQHNYDLTVLYLCVFIPFQGKSIYEWRKSQHANHSSSADTASSVKSNSGPTFLSLRNRLLSLLFFAVVIVADYFFATYIIQHNAPGDAVATKVFGAVMIASSILSNFWLIFRKTDAWLYWVLYSFAGIAFFALIGNAFSVLLFCFFLVINGMAGISWFRLTRQQTI